MTRRVVLVFAVSDDGARRLLRWGDPVTGRVEVFIWEPVPVREWEATDDDGE